MSSTTTNPNHITTAINADLSGQSSGDLYALATRVLVDNGGLDDASIEGLRIMRDEFEAILKAKHLAGTTRVWIGNQLFGARRKLYIAAHG